MKVWSIWQIPPKGKENKYFAVETLVLETPDLQEAEQLQQRLLKQGVDVRLFGPHEPMDTDSDFPLSY